MSKKHRHKTEKVNVDVVDELDDIKCATYGIVVDCPKLNVRETPNRNGTIMAQIDEYTEVVIEEEESTDDFYKVCLATGLEGYCSKQFIEIRI